MKKRLIPSICTGLAAALYFFVILPVQTYIACVETPPYSLGDLLWEFSLYFVIAWAVVGAALFALSYVPLAKPTIDAKGRKRKKISLQFHVFVLAVVVAAIVESGPLAIGLPELNGEFVGYRSLVRCWVDLVVLVAAIAVPMVCYKWLKHYVSWIALAVAVYASASILDVRKAKSFSEDGGDFIIHGFIPRYEVVDGAAFSPSNNVIVLILDTLSSHAMAEIFRDDPKFAEHFPGFVNYANNLGMHWTTAVGVPGLMTGRLYENSADLSKYGVSPYTGESFIKEYVESKVPVYLNLSIGPLGWSNRINTAGSRGKAARPSQVMIYNTLELNVLDLALFRVAPYMFKERVAMAATSRNGTADGDVKQTAVRGNISRDETIWPLLASRPIDDSFQTALHIHHSLGGHPPFTHDENGQRANMDADGFKVYVSHCKFALKQLARCFDVWQTNGVYDASTIVLTSDHGVSKVWPETKPYLHGIPSYAFPALMVKPKGARTPYVESTMPTWHAKIAPIVRALKTKVLNQSEIEAMLHADERVCRTCGGAEITDWIASGDWVVRKVVRPDIQKDSSALRKLQLDKTYSFLITASPENYPDYIVDNGNRGSSSGLSAPNIRKPLRISFKAPAANKTYDVMLRAGIHQNPEDNIANIIARCGSAIASFMSDKPTGDQYYLLLKGCKSGADGILTIEVYYAADPQRAGKFYFNLANMRISKHMSANLVENDFFPGKIEKSIDLLQCWRVDAKFASVQGESASLAGHGDNVAISSPSWFLKNGGQGVSIEGRSLEAECRLVCKGEGDVVIGLLGVNRAVNNRSLHLYADFESFKINGKEMLENPVSTWYGSIFKIPIHVKDGEELDIAIRLKRHEYGYVELRNLLLDAQRWTSQTEQSVDGLLTLPTMQEFLSD